MVVLRESSLITVAGTWDPAHIGAEFDKHEMDMSHWGVASTGHKSPFTL
jgi:hypothetical protein